MLPVVFVDADVADEPRDGADDEGETAGGLDVRAACIVGDGVGVVVGVALVHLGDDGADDVKRLADMRAVPDGVADAGDRSDCREYRGK